MFVSPSNALPSIGLVILKIKMATVKLERLELFNMINARFFMNTAGTPRSVYLEDPPYPAIFPRVYMVSRFSALQVQISTF